METNTFIWQFSWATMVMAALDLEGAMEPLKLEKASRSFHVSHWTSDDGLPNNGVQCLMQGRDDYLWIGTKDGLVRYDGVRFNVFDAERLPAFHEENDDFCNSICQDDQGVVWMGTPRGLVRAALGRFDAYALPSPKGPIWAITPRRDGGIWVGGDHGLIRIAAGETNRVPVIREGHWTGQVTAIVETEEGELWVATGDHGLCRRSQAEGPLQPVLSETDFPRDTSFLRDRAGRIWWGRSNALHSWTPQEGVRHHGIIAQAEGQLTVLLEDREGRFWWADRSGHLFASQEDQIREVVLAPPKQLGRINCMMEDRDGNLWCGTEHDGLYRLTPRQVRTYTEEDGLSHDDVWSISQGPDGRIWIATSRGLNSFDDERFQNYYVRNSGGVANRVNRLRSVAVNGKGEVWTGGHELYRLVDETLVEARPDFEGSWGQIHAIYHDRADATWVCADTGLYELRPGMPARLWTEPFLSSSNVLNILQEDKATYWVGTIDGGVTRIQEGTNDVYTMANGLLSNLAGPLRIEADGTVWLGSDRGLMCLKSGRITPITREQGLMENLVLNLLEDDRGRFWLNGHAGIQIVPKKELMELVAGARTGVRSRLIGTAEGMLHPEGNGGFFPNSCRSQDGRFWFPTIKGLMVVDPERIPDRTRPPTVHIQWVKVDGEVVCSDGWSDPTPNAVPEPGEVIHCQPGSGRAVEIHFSGIHFLAPSQIRFEYRLLGYDPQWKQGGSQRMVAYTNLRPGTYVFEVRAAHNKNLWNAAGASLTFRLPPRIFQTWWFRSLCGLLVVVPLVLLMIYRRHQGQHLLEAARRSAREEQRARIARDIHDELGSTLTNIALLGELIQRDKDHDTKMKRQAGRISEMAGGAVDALSDLVWATNPKYDSMESMVAYLRRFAAEFLGDAGLRHQLEFPSVVPNMRVSGHVRQGLHRVLKEALRNIVRHASATRVVLRLELDQNQISVSLTDNGQGMQMSEGPQGSGLQNMEVRIHELGGSLRVRSEPGLGTTVSVKIPIQSEGAD